MIDFPLDGLLDEQACLAWLEQQLHPEGLRCPRCGRPERRRARKEATIPAFRCTRCDRYYTALSGTIFAKTRQPPSKIVLMLRGIAKGEPTSRLARELGICRKQMHTLRHRVQDNLYETLPTHVLEEPVFEADELYQNAGEKGQIHLDPADPPRRRANKRRGHGTYERMIDQTDRPPIFSVVARQSGQVRYFVRERSDAATCLAVVQSTVQPGARVLYTDEWQGYGRVGGLGLGHGTVKHGRDAEGHREWARDDDGDGIREVHCNTCEGGGAGLRSFLRAFRGVHSST